MVDSVILDKLFDFNINICECDIETYNLTLNLLDKLALDESYIPSMWWVAHKYIDDGSSHLIDIICVEWHMDASEILEKELEILTLLNWVIEDITPPPTPPPLNRG